MTPLVLLKIRPGGRPARGETERRVGARDREAERLAQKGHRAQRAGHHRRRIGTGVADTVGRIQDKSWE